MNALGEYVLEHELGRGSTGVVYAAVHPLTGACAVEVLDPDLCADTDRLERFLDALRVVREIDHPNIARVLAIGEAPNGRRYLVRERLAGETLRARLATRSLSLDEIRTIIQPIARALQAAHDRGLVHLALAPESVFLVEMPEREPVATLLDLGVARLRGATPPFAAPEQAKGDPIDPRADIYALGAILFELLTGRPPFIAATAMEMVAKHLMEAPARPSSIQRTVSAELDDLVLRMLAKTPAGRPSLGELIAILERSRTSAATLPFDRLTPPWGK